jgi:DNA-binding XRE family transcriptional regulator
MKEQKIALSPKRAAKLARIQQARRYREQGYTNQEVAAALGVTFQTVSIWTKGMPRPRIMQFVETQGD